MKKAFCKIMKKIHILKPKNTNKEPYGRRFT